MKKYLITGLLVWLPIIVTIWVIQFMFDTIENLIPARYSIEHILFGRSIPGVRVALILIVLLLTGLLTANFLGQKLLAMSESILGKIPIVRGIYQSVKQVSDTVLSPNGQAFNKAVLIQYPSTVSWTIAFQTGEPPKTLQHLLNDSLISVYVPTTPNPTSGFFLIVPKKSVIPLDISVDAALKYIVSMGVVVPSELEKK